MNADTESLQTPGHLDTFTGVSRSNYTAGPSQAYQPIRDDVNVKLNHFVSGSRVDHNIRFGVQIARNLDRGQHVWPGGVLYLDFKGAPDQAQYQSPLVYAAESRSQGVWAEDELTMGRLTMTPGVRFDRMVAISPAAPVVDPAAYSGTDGLCRCNQSFGKTGATIPGLGEMFSWNKVSPRMGINVRLTSDSRTVLRATVGRYYRPVFLNDFTGVHPGITPVTLARFDPVTRDYTTIISVTDSTANLAVDEDVEAPYTDQYSIGVDREIARNLGVSVTYVHKTSSDQIGWRDIGGIYGTQTVASPAGPVTVYPLMNAPSERRFLRTNGPGFFSRYHGLVLSASRRLATRWMLNLNYAYSKTEGLQAAGTAVFASTVGQDPNDYVNLTGRLSPNDRPHVLTVTGSVQVSEDRRPGVGQSRAHVRASVCPSDSGGPAAGAAQCQLRRAGLVSSAERAMAVPSSVEDALPERAATAGVGRRVTQHTAGNERRQPRVEDLFQPELWPADHLAHPATTTVSGEGVFLTVMRRWPWLRAAITVAASLTPAAAQGQDTAAPTGSLTGVLTLYSVSQEAPGGAFPEAAPYYIIRERTYRKVLGDALGDQLDYYSELLDRYHFPDPSYESDFEDYLARKYADRMIKLLIANGPDEAALAGRLQARLPSQPPIVFVEHDARPVPKSTGHTYRWPFKESLDLALRVHPRHPSRVRLARRISAGCTKRRQVSLSGTRAAARRGVHLLARRLAT